MSTVTRIQVVPRTAVEAGLRLARLPLTVATRAARQQDNAEWPPTLAFEGFEAGVETVAGALLRDRALQTRGRLRQAKVAQVRKAVELETIADQAREQADATLEARREQAEQVRERAEETAERRERQVGQQAAARLTQAQQKAAKKKAAAARVKATQDEALTRQERVATAEALAKESEALAVTKQALDAEETVEVIDDSIEGTKAARKTS
jgi:hypothetical protein